MPVGVLSWLRNCSCIGKKILRVHGVEGVEWRALGLVCADVLRLKSTKGVLVSNQGQVPLTNSTDVTRDFEGSRFGFKLKRYFVPTAEIGTVRFFGGMDLRRESYSIECWRDGDQFD